ncbi:hypothetical protein D9M72_594380 [compost metagenome]
MARDLVTTPGCCMSDLPGILDVMIVEADRCLGSTREDELRALARELRQCGAMNPPTQCHDRFYEGLGVALELVERRLEQLE